QGRHGSLLPARQPVARSVGGKPRFPARSGTPSAPRARSEAPDHATWSYPRVRTRERLGGLVTGCPVGGRRRTGKGVAWWPRQLGRGRGGPAPTPSSTRPRQSRPSGTPCLVVWETRVPPGLSATPGRGL